MKLIFSCPVHGATFESAAYSIIDNRGVASDASGNRFLDARVALDAPCPHCGGMHIYHATELPCPFGGTQ